MIASFYVGHLEPEKTTTTTSNQRAPRNERNDRRENKKNSGSGSNVRDGDEEEGVAFSKESHPPRKQGGRQRLNSKEKVRFGMEE